MTKEMVNFGVVVVAKDKKKFLELNAKFEEMMKVYEEERNRIHQLEVQWTKWISNLERKR